MTNHSNSIEQTGKKGGAVAVPLTLWQRVTPGAKLVMTIGGIVLAFLFFVGALAVGQYAGDTDENKKPAVVSTAVSTPKVEVKTDTRIEPIGYAIERLADSLTDEGTEALRQQGSNGEHTYTYRVTYEDGREVKRELTGSSITKAPMNSIVAFGTKKKTPEISTNCTPGYSPCLPPMSDYDCSGGSGNGPGYTGTVSVSGPDIYDLDRDGDGVGCE